MMRARSSILKCHRSFLFLSNPHRNKTTSETKTTTTTSVDTSKERFKGVAPESEKLSARPPLVKNFFVGTVDKELLPFPEVIKREDLSTVRKELLPIETYFRDERFINAYTNRDENDRSLTPQLIDEVKQLGLFGINAEKNYHGKGWNWSESLHASEPETVSTELSLGLLSHRVIIDLLQEAGTDEQKEQFLKNLAQGTLIGAEAVFEYQAPENGFFDTKADFCMETKQWTISGQKGFVVTPPTGHDGRILYLVIAETERLNLTGEAARGTTIFLVDSSLPGVWAGDVHKTIGCEGLPMRHVKFDRVQVPESCIIGYAHEGNKYADLLLRSSRLRSSIISLGLAKKLVNELAQHCVDSKHCGSMLSELESNKTHLSRSVCAVYAIESMLFYTAGLLDEFNKPDVLLEAAIIKYFALKELLTLAVRSTEIIGPKSLHAGNLSETVFRDALQMYTQGETMDTLRFFIALSGFQYAGTLINESVRMSRNPLFHPGHFLGKLMQNSTIDTPKTKMRLADQLHPGLEHAALSIEHSVARLQMCVDLLLIRYGSKIIERHNEIHRISEMAAMIFAMFASASRASRSYCIGLQYADNEMLLATTICNHGRDTVKILAADIFNGEVMNNDRNLQRLSAQVFKSKGYYPIHPLTYNF